MNSWRIIITLCVGAIFAQFSKGELIIEQTETGFTISIIGSSFTIFRHENSNPSFSIDETIVNFQEYRGNFQINETVLRNAIPLDNYDIENIQDEFGRNSTIIKLTNTFNPNEGLEVTLWDWEVLNQVNISCSFRLQIFQNSSSTLNRIRMRVPSTLSEHLYGLGEQFTHFDLKGYNFTVWTREQGVGRNKSDPLTQWMDALEGGAGGDYHFTYWPQSSYISAQSRYLLAIKSHVYSVFDFQNENYSEMSFQSERIEGYFVHEPQSLLKLVNTASQIHGRQPQLPEWVYNGAILGVQGGTQKMLDFLDEAEENGVAVSAMWVQDWSGKINTEFGTRVFWNWKWNSSWYPELDQAILELKEKRNVRVLAYVNPSLNVEGDVFKEGEIQEAFLRKVGSPNETYLQDFGDFYCGTVDFWSEKAVEWYKNVVKENMLRFGFSGWMADFGEYTPLDTASVNESVPFSAQERHNQLPTLWAKLNREAVEEEGQLGDIMFWTRSGSSGASRYSTMLWGGDQNVDWSFSDGLPSAITAALSAGLSGMGLFHFDIGGYTTIELLGLKRSKELLLRSAEIAVFTPIMRTHEGNQPAANHQVYSDPDTWQKFGRLTQIYKMLSNYTRSVVKENSEMGVPVMRPLFLHYEQDLESYDHNYQYLLGRDLLVAPVLFPNMTDWSLYLPPDIWIFLWSDPHMEEQAIVGGINITFSSPLGYPPVFFRNSSDWVDLFRNIRNTFYDGYNNT